ncbi:tryptophan-rich sensory protein [Aureimonas flava]|uniref:Tryptophan-rich sensory protein n=1 Tax=Aureimonas flava TaxID=2320271 RepID=A0A3A1WN79_9HYPH|nr:TspO/MBR family protein [Aureimonas flava]RIY01447.1 tryptophan-rich sensory protein [Aureimonas flava]
MTLADALVLLGFVALSGLVATSGVLFRPGPWYAGLRKPTWTPPNRAFPIVWSILYLLIALSGWLVWRAAGWQPVPFVLFGLQMALNFLWSWLFFGLRRPLWALADIGLLALAVALTALAFAPHSATAALLLVPYLAWVCVAALLNLSVWRLNRERGVFA